MGIEIGKYFIQTSVTLSGIPGFGLSKTRKVLRNAVEGLIAKGFKVCRGSATGTSTSQRKNNEVDTRYSPAAPLSVTSDSVLKLF